MSIVGCALIADWQAIVFDKCTYFSPYHNPTILAPTRRSVESFTGADSRLQAEVQRGVNEYDDFMYTYDGKISCSIISEQGGCALNECRLIQYSPGFKFDEYSYPCENIDHDKHAHAYECDFSNQEKKYCLYINETNHDDQVSIQTFAANSKQLLTHYEYKDIIKQCTEADVGDDHCHWIPDSLVTRHYCTDCPPICRALSKSLSFVQFCLGAALLMLSIPVAWVPVASMASERTSKEMQVQLNIGSLIAVLSHSVCSQSIISLATKLKWLIIVIHFLKQ
jgi:hypothetical protein